LLKLLTESIELFLPIVLIFLLFDCSARTIICAKIVALVHRFHHLEPHSQVLDASNPFVSFNVVLHFELEVSVSLLLSFGLMRRTPDIKGARGTVCGERLHALVNVLDLNLAQVDLFLLDLLLVMPPSEGRACDDDPPVVDLLVQRVSLLLDFALDSDRVRVFLHSISQTLHYKSSPSLDVQVVLFHYVLGLEQVNFQDFLLDLVWEVLLGAAPRMAYHVVSAQLV
jgi:hypothetical protein